MTTLLVVGGGSFTAPHLVRHCRTAGWNRIVATRRREVAGAGDADVVGCDVGDAADVAAVVDAVQPDGVVYLAGRASGEDAVIRSSNVDGVLNVVAAVARHASHARVLHLGSAAEYGCVADDRLPVRETEPAAPESPYAMAKHEGVERALETAGRDGVQLVVARPFNFIGAGMPPHLLVGALLERIAAALASGSDVVVAGDLSPERDFLAVDDVVRALTLLLDRGAAGEVYNVCSGRPVPVRDVVGDLVALSPRPLRVVRDAAIRGVSACARSYGSPDKLAALGFVPRTSIREALLDAWRGHGLPERGCA